MTPARASRSFEGLKARLVEPWTEPCDPRALAICRCLVFGFAWPGFRFTDVSAFTQYERLIFHPIGILGALHVPLASASVLRLLGMISSAASGLALLGAGYGVTAPLAAFVGLYESWVVQSSGKSNHGGLLFHSVIIMLAFARAADAWSVDALVRRSRGFARPAASAEYRWPIRFISVLVISMYGAAGLSKLTTTGWRWGLSGSLRLRLLSHHFSHSPPTRIGVVLARSKLACRVLGTAALLLEVCSPLAQLDRWVYRVVIPSLALLQFSIWLMLGVYFREMVPIFACLLPWDRLVAAFDERSLPERRPARIVAPRSGAS